MVFLPGIGWLLRIESEFPDALEGGEHRLDQYPLLFKTLLIEVGIHQDDLAGTAADQTCGKLGESLLIGIEFE